MNPDNFRWVMELYVKYPTADWYELESVGDPEQYKGE